ncbi:MAG: hypothetical protein ACD_12C00013G0001 [uncultured bacterium]|nr:MAG: hypothetical protein ACD_12C00013G0001 [uncultured bacterium]
MMPSCQCSPTKIINLGKLLADKFLFPANVRKSGVFLKSSTQVAEKKFTSFAPLIMANLASKTDFSTSSCLSIFILPILLARVCAFFSSLVQSRRRASIACSSLPIALILGAIINPTS